MSRCRVGIRVCRGVSLLKRASLRSVAGLVLLLAISFGKFGVYFCLHALLVACALQTENFNPLSLRWRWTLLRVPHVRERRKVELVVEPESSWGDAERF